MSSIEINAISGVEFPIINIGDNEYYFGLDSNVNNPLNAILHTPIVKSSAT